MLKDVPVHAMLPVDDLAAAAKFYEDVLGLERVHEEPGVAVKFRSGDCTMFVYASRFAGTNRGTAAMWEVEDVEAVVDDLRSRGVSFEHYEGMPGLTLNGDIHEAGEFKVAWFKDPAGNILSVQTGIRSSAHEQPAEEAAVRESSSAA